MKIAKSKFGLILAGIYLFVVSVIFIYGAYLCEDESSCFTAFIVMAILLAPMTFIPLPISLPSQFLVLIMIAVNTILIYFIGLLIQRIFEKIRNKQQIK